MSKVFSTATSYFFFAAENFSTIPMSKLRAKPEFYD